MPAVVSRSDGSSGEPVSTRAYRREYTAPTRNCPQVPSVRPASTPPCATLIRYSATLSPLANTPRLCCPISAFGATNHRPVSSSGW